MDTLPQPILEASRPFEWGIVLVCDGQSTDEWPELQRGAAFAASRACLGIVVRHAQDTEADVESLKPSDPVPPFKVAIRCWLDAVPPPDAPIRIALDVPSGRVVVGDAAGWDSIELLPGEWSVCAAPRPFDYPESVDLWFTKADA